MCEKEDRITRAKNYSTSQRITLNYIELFKYRLVAASNLLRIAENPLFNRIRIAKCSFLKIQETSPDRQKLSKKELPDAIKPEVG